MDESMYAGPGGAADGLAALWPQPAAVRRRGGSGGGPGVPPGGRGRGADAGGSGGGAPGGVLQAGAHVQPGPHGGAPLLQPAGLEAQPLRLQSGAVSEGGRATAGGRPYGSG